MMFTTCQICGRVIKANTGLIAAHGYRRPGNGWQTSSCKGARYKPYEVSCDRIPEVIRMADTFERENAATLSELRKNPPAELITFDSRGKEYKATRPDNFDPSARPSYIPHAYDTLYKERVYNLEQNILAARHSQEVLTERLAKWKAQPDG